MKKYIFYSLIVFIFFESTSNSSLEFFEKEKHDQLFKRILQNVCNPESCPPFQGYCRDDDCVCLEGYITKKDPMNHKFCNYRQKSVIISLLLEAFGLIGFGHVYAGRIFYGVLKLVAFYLLICCGSQFVITLMKENSDTDTAYYIKLMLSTAILGLPVLWHFIDLYKWGTNQYLDGNEQSMESW